MNFKQAKQLSGLCAAFVTLALAGTNQASAAEKKADKKSKSAVVYPNNPMLKKDTDPNFLYLADPAAEVFNGRVYVYCSHDQPDATNYHSMQDYALLSSDDMINWTNHGVFIKPREYAWTKAKSGLSQMNAPDAVYNPKDGYYYFYFPYDRTYIGVVRSKTPEGPYEVIKEGYVGIMFDPTVIIDDDGQAYIYGNDHKQDIGDKGWHVMGAKLKDNMMELDGDWKRLSKETVNEAVHVFKREGKYHFTGRVGSSTGYWTSDNPLPVYDMKTDTGGATYHGLVATPPGNAPAHNSFIEFDNQWYIFYHRGDVNDGAHYKRSACFDKVYFDEKGIMKPVQYTYGDQSMYGDQTAEITGSFDYPKLKRTAYSIDELHIMATDSKGARFPEGTTWYIQDNKLEKVEPQAGNDKLDDIITAATKSGKYEKGSITLDFSHSTIMRFDAAFCPAGKTGGAKGYNPDFDCVGAIVGLDKVNSMLAWTIRNMQYLKKVEGLSLLMGTLGNYSFYDLPALESIDLPMLTGLGVAGFAHCPNLKVINTPKLKSFRDSSFQNAAPKTWYLTAKDDMTKTVILAESLDASGCDLYLSGVNFKQVTNGNQWKGKTWKSITEVK